MARLAVRTCSECGTPLEGNDPRRKTCTASCRAKRSRRLKRKTDAATAARARPAHQRHVAAIVEDEIPDVAHEVIAEELRPIVREAITEEVLRSIDQLVALTPDAIKALGEDLESTDDRVRQTAYTLALKYTVGNAAITSDDQPTGLVVNFELPRPGRVAQEDAVPADSEEVKECLVCQEDKPLSEFVSNSDRCTTCHAAYAEKVKGLLAP